MVVGSLECTYIYIIANTEVYLVMANFTTGERIDCGIYMCCYTRHKEVYIVMYTCITLT